MRIATWNINSVRLRLPLVKQFAEEAKPDILCLQETKVEDALFPADDLKQMGFKHLAFVGQKSYNGVAILSKKPLAKMESLPMAGKSDCRHVMAWLGGEVCLHNFYIPAGGDIPDPNVNDKFEHKLAFVDHMTRYFKDKQWKESRAIILGDFNIAPQEHDVWSHKQLLDVVSHTPIEVEKLGKLQESQNWVDVGRHFTPSEQKLYSWWSYRNRDWEKSNRGRRLDHVWVTPALKDGLKSVQHLRDLRGWQQPSDHVPVVADIQW